MMSTAPLSVTSVLDAYQSLVLATVDGQGQPEAAAIFYARDRVQPEGVTLIAAFLRSSQKLEHLRSNPRAGLYIGPERPTRWIQGACLAEILDNGPEADEALATLVQATPEAGIFVRSVPVTAVRLRVTKLKLTDLTVTPPEVLSIELSISG